MRRQFQRIRPERYRTVRGLEDGEDFDLNAVVDARVELARRAARRRPGSTSRAREERDVATLFLVDMSASTDEPLQPKSPSPRRRRRQPHAGTRGERAARIIDVTKEALVIMAEALEEIGDATPSTASPVTAATTSSSISSSRSTSADRARARAASAASSRSAARAWATALRHARAKMANLTSRSKHIFLLSDGFPQDFDYGQDRRSNVYGIRDTTVALRECEAAGITPFCITVDKAGHDYLREMCESSRYMVIEDIASLPRELPKIYQRWVRA